MNEFFNFFHRHSKWLVFLIYVILSCVLLIKSSPYQQHVYLTSANTVASAVYGGANNVTSYFNLRQNNEDLNRRNAELQAEVIHLHQQLQDLSEKYGTDTMSLDSTVMPFRFIVAHVINNSVARPYNYLTINKGSADGVKPEWGVIDQNGVVGIVSNVGPHSARVISLLNPNFRLSCKIKGSEYFGSLVWDGNDPQMALLEELPRHTQFSPGDTIVTSGYSAVFPAGLPVGVIEDNGEHKAENFFTLHIRLLSDFTGLNNVQVVVNNLRQELKELESNDDNGETKKYPVN